jgi:hypothetical protein
VKDDCYLKDIPLLVTPIKPESADGLEDHFLPDHPEDMLKMVRVLKLNFIPLMEKIIP